jgi:hypothetical protein
VVAAGAQVRIRLAEEALPARPALRVAAVAALVLEVANRQPVEQAGSAAVAGGRLMAQEQFLAQAALAGVEVVVVTTPTLARVSLAALAGSAAAAAAEAMTPHPAMVALAARALSSFTTWRSDDNVGTHYQSGRH